MFDKIELAHTILVAEYVDILIETNVIFTPNAELKA